MSTHKLTKQELKTPDRIWLASKEILDYLVARWVLFAVALGIIIVGLIGGTVYVQMSRVSEGKAQFHLGQAKTYFEQWKLQSGDEKVKTEALVLKELDTLKSEFGSSKAKGLSEIYRGELFLNAKKYPEAIEAFRSFEKALPKEEKALAQLNLGHVYEVSGDYQQAERVYEDVLKNKDSAFYVAALLSKARSLRLQGKNAEAASVYSAFLEKFPAHQDIAEVRGLLALTSAAQKTDQK